MNDKLKSICLVIITICFMSITHNLKQTIPTKINKVINELSKIEYELELLRKRI